ncbi:MAG: hypothetical protein Q9191_001805 [Dirinaria sp. TL-2023a]
MQLFQVLIRGLLLALAVPALGSCAECPLGLELAVIGTIRLGKPLRSITVPGGSRNIEPIIGGTLSGVINATIEGGVAYPQVFENGTVSVPQIILYGTTSDNSSFLVQEAGVGSLAHQNTRIDKTRLIFIYFQILEVGGKEAPLMDEFIIASVTPSKDRKTVAIKGYIVP